MMVILMKLLGIHFILYSTHLKRVAKCIMPDDSIIIAGSRLMIKSNIKPNLTLFRILGLKIRYIFKLR
jgi:hypothetical protein